MQYKSIRFFLGGGGDKRILCFKNNVSDSRKFCINFRDIDLIIDEDAEPGKMSFSS
jgi:hypothetical protein